MKIAITSDLHFYNWPAFANNTRTFNSRNLEIASVVGKIFETCAKAQVEHVFILGDIFHNKHKIDVDSLLLFKATVRSFPGHVHIIPGNHDIPFSTQNYSVVDIFDSPTLHIYSHPQILNLTGEDNRSLAIMLIPYLEDSSKIKEILEQQVGKTDYIFGHFGIKNASLINTDFRDKHSLDLSEFEDPRIKRIILGHYHTPQKVPGLVPTYYVGSPLHHTFNDEGQQKRFLILDLEKNTLLNVETSYPQFVTCNFNEASEIEAYKFNKNDYYRIYVKAEINPVKVSELLQGNDIKYVLAYKNLEKKVVHLGDKQLNENVIIKRYLIRSEISDKSDIYQIIRDLQNEVGTA